LISKGGRKRVFRGTFCNGVGVDTNSLKNSVPPRTPKSGGPEEPTGVCDNGCTKKSRKIPACKKGKRLEKEEIWKPRARVGTRSS